MPYEIKHQSRNECRIRYVKGDDPDIKIKLSWPIIGFGFVAVFMGLEFFYAILIVFIIIRGIEKLQPPRPNFEIELNRPNNRITVRDIGQTKPKKLIYPLNHLIGFGLSEISAPKQSKHGAYTELYFNFDGAAKLQLKTYQVSLLSRAEKQETQDGRIFLKTPIRSKSYPVPHENGIDILEAVEAWLGKTENIAENISEDVLTPDLTPPVETADVIRDFRDIDSGEE